jgi:molybdate/tungstate transport system ATP-binding protein
VIHISNLHLVAGKFRLQNVSFLIPQGSYCTLMGKTGSGKTSITEAICGLRRIQAGKIVVDGLDVTQLKPAERNIGYVPQDGAMFTTMTVAQQLGFALRVRRVNGKLIQTRVHELAELLEISHLLDRSVEMLSGGERQRVALGRALSFKPRTLCLDEPLSALDDDTRMQMMHLLKRVQAETGVTCLHITHHAAESEFLADMRLQIRDGSVTACAKASES